MVHSAEGHDRPLVGTTSPDDAVGGMDLGREDIRFAVVLNGGVSLAIWISGVALELHHLGLASRGRGDWPTYRAVLDLVNATARVDVISGTSAGGLNGAFLALGIARDRDFGTLRELWRHNGAFDALLRRPLQKDPPSLLRGDEYFLTQVRQALQTVADGPEVAEVTATKAAGTSASRNLDLFLTGTLWAGRTSVFTDDMGTAIAERDHDATFRFFLDSPEDALAATPSPCGDLTTSHVVDELARAARCTSSFPGAFEPHYVTIADGDIGTDQRTPSAAGRANFTDPQYVIDGGVLLNKPIRPALQAVYVKPAELQVRRVLAYVVPDPGEPPAASTVAAVGAAASAPTAARDGAVPALPQARDVLLAVLTRLRSTDSVSRELSEIRTRNADVRARRRARDRLAAALTAESQHLAARTWPGYREVRADHAARTIGRLLVAGQQGRADRWSERELVEAITRLPLTFLPAGEGPDGLAAAVQRTGAEWDWGQTTVQRLGDMTLDVLRRALWLAPQTPGLQVLGRADPRVDIVGARERAHATLAEIRANRATLDAYWLAIPNGNRVLGIPPMPGPGRGTNESADNLEALQSWLSLALEGWDRLPNPAADPKAASGPRRAELYTQALALADCLLSSASAIHQVAVQGSPAVDPLGSEQEQLAAFDEYLFAAGRDGTPDAAEVMRRMLRLDVVQLAFSGATQEVEQEVELIQVSSSHRELLTGVQLHHFGAFYRAPWRVNDWIHGRMDGAEQLMTVLLSPERLRQTGWTEPAQLEGLLEEVHRIAVPAAHRDRDWLERRWSGDGRVEGDRAACRTELAAVLGPGLPPTSLDACARAVARPVQLGILSDDLVALADAIRAEGGDTLPTSSTWLATYAATDGASAAGLWSLWEGAAAIGRQRIPDDAGSDTFARTISHAATVAAGTVGATVPGRAGTSRPAKSVLRLLSAFRGYTLMVWGMIAYLTRPSNVGLHVVELALAAGGVLVGVTLLVPGVPLGLTLFGVLLLLAGLTAAALRSRDSRPVGRRLVAPLLVVAIALGLLIWRDIADHGLTGSTVWTSVIKFLVAVLIALLGLWVARAARYPGKAPRRPAPVPTRANDTASPRSTTPDRASASRDETEKVR